MICNQQHFDSHSKQQAIIMLPKQEIPKNLKGTQMNPKQQIEEPKKPDVYNTENKKPDDNNFQDKFIKQKEGS